jgi:hypothetical protein
VNDINLFTANNKLKMHIQLFEDRKSDSRPHNRVDLKAAGNFKFRNICIEKKYTGRKEGTNRCLDPVTFYGSLKQLNESSILT